MKLSRPWTTGGTTGGTTSGATTWATAGAILAALGPAVFLVCWLSGVPGLAAFAGPRMKTNTCVALLLGAGALVCAAWARSRWPARMLGLLCAAMGLASVLQNVIGLDLGIDQLLAVEVSPPPEAASHPNRMSPIASGSLLLLGLGLILVRGTRRQIVTAQLLAAAIVTLNVLALIGYLYDASFLYQPTAFIRISPYSAGVLLVLAASLLVLHPDLGLARRFVGNSPGSLLARRMMAVTALLPVLLGWLRLQGDARGLFNASTGTALLVIVTIGVLTTVVFFLAHSLDLVDARRSASEEDLRQASELIGALARASTMAEVAGATTDVGLPALGASAGGLLVMAEGGTSLQLTSSSGYDPARREPYQTIPITAPLPVCEAARAGKPVFLSNREELQRRYPALVGETAEIHQAWAVLPLQGRDRMLGVIALSFLRPQAFDDETRARLMRLAWQCAQALERALLFDSEAAASRTKDEFLAMLGHELRNPLSPIVTSLHLMRLRAGDQLQKERATIERQVQHLVRLVDDLMDVSRITRGRIELRKRWVELAQVVGAAAEAVNPLIVQQGHKLTIEVPPGLGLRADPDRLTQVISNILSNAAKYTEPGGTIQLAVHREGDQAVVRIEDSGAGIPAELLPRIFDPFVQGRRTIDRAQGGLGLGLAIVKSLVHLHGGTVSATSGGSSLGSVFTVSLPIDDNPAAAATPAPAPAIPPAQIPIQAAPRISAAPGRGSGGSRRILVVDDNREAAESLGEALAAAGHDVHLAHDGVMAVELGSKLRPEVVLLDIGLPRLDGYEVAQRLRGLDGDYRPLLVAVSGYGQDSDRVRARQAGFDQHLVKPVSLEDTLALVEGGDDNPT